MIKKIIRILILFSLILTTLQFAHASVEVFTKYDTTININKNYTIDVSKKILLRNIHEVGIIPGEIEFKIISAFEKNSGDIINLEAKDRYGNPIKSKIQKTGDQNVIILNIFTPILPGFEYQINLDYTIQYESTGIFFKTLQIPLKESSKIPIQNSNVKVILPDSYHLTYVDYKDENTIIEGKEITWIVNENTPEISSIEYSYLPISIGNLRGSLVFWLLVNILLIAVLLLQVVKEAKRLRNFKK